MAASDTANLLKQQGIQVLPCVIPDNADGLSAAVNILGRAIVGIMMPADWSAADLTMQVSVDGTLFHNAYDDADGELTIQAAEDRFIVLDPSTYAGLPFIKLRSGTSAVPVDQNASRTLYLVVRDLQGR